MYYTPAQVQEMLNIPPSTLRFYSKRFANLLTPKGERKHRLYTDQDIATIKIIRDLAKAGTPLDLIESKIQVMPKPETSRPVENSLALVPAIAAEIANAQETANAAKAQADQLARLVDDLTNRLDQQQEQLDQFNEYFSLPWWKRIFSHPPGR